MYQRNKRWAFNWNKRLFNHPNGRRSRFIDREGYKHPAMGILVVNGVPDLSAMVFLEFSGRCYGRGREIGHVSIYQGGKFTLGFQIFMDGRQVYRPPGEPVRRVIPRPPDGFWHKKVRS